MNIKTSFTQLSVALFLLSGFLFTGCFKDKCNLEFRYMEYVPVYMSQDDFVNSVGIQSPKNLKKPGKILVHGNYLFVNEVAKGIHVFDNTNPSSPVALSFIAIPGNYDLASDCDILYADASTDLLVFDISLPSAPALVSRVSNALPHMLFYRGYSADPDKGVVVDWVGEEKTGTVKDCDLGPPQVWAMNMIEPGDPNSTGGGGNETRSGSAVPGTAGSTSRFTVSAEHLYVVTPQELRVFDITNCSEPVQGNQVSLSNNMWGGQAETVFAYEDLIFIGSETGMFIYDNSNPDFPTFISSFNHAQACDPVYVVNDYAYITLRTERDNFCMGWTNQLDVVNVSNPWQPRHVSQVLMTYPQGLGADKNVLFVTDGSDGVKVFDISDPENKIPAQIASLDIHGYDVIPDDGILVVLGKDGLSQYDYTDVNNISRLSFIPVVE